MPPKAKKKRASLHLDTDTGQIKEAGESREVKKNEPAVRQVVEVVDEEKVPEAIDTIKKDAEEIEEAVLSIEEEVKAGVSEEEKKVISDDVPESVIAPVYEEVAEDSKGSVESLFTKATASVSPEITVVGKRSKPIGVWVGAMLGIALAVGVSLILLVRGPSRISLFAPSPTPLAKRDLAPPETPTPTSTVVRKDVKVSVLNGGGTVGAGSKMKAFLENKGYTVSSVGNADAYTYTDTEIHVKKGKEAYATLLKDDLKSDYTLASSTGSVDDSVAYDVQVIVGKE